MCWTEKVKEEIKSSPSNCLDCSTLIVATGPTATGGALCNVIMEPRYLTINYLTSKTIQYVSSTFLAQIIIVTFSNAFHIYHVIRDVRYTMAAI